MLKLIKDGIVYSPKLLGKKDVLLAAGKIVKIDEQINVSGVDIKVIDANQKIVVPGFIDNHVHIIGGGGEGGFATRTPEISFSELVESGITTVVGCLGTDGFCRNMSDLLAKAKSLNEQGISSYIYTGSYQVPVRSLTSSIAEDIMYIDQIIGVGEIAISDHRSSQPTLEELCRIASEARVSGILSGKAGIVNLHLGSGKRKLELVEKIISETEIPASQFLPTHLNRNEELLQSSIKFALNGGYIDFTTSSSKKHMENGELSAADSLQKAIDAGVDPERISFSSDGQGSLPIFDENGKFLKLGIGSTQSLFDEVKKAVKNYGIDLETALQVITSNSANILKLKSKGFIQPGLDADLVILDKEELSIESVIAKGKILMQNNKLLKKGMFE